MDRLIFCQGNSKYLYCPGVNYITKELGITLKPVNPFDKYSLYSERLKTIPCTIPAQRRIELADWGYYASGLSRSLRCFWCHSLAQQQLVRDGTISPASIHNPDVSCDFLKIAKENSSGENVKCSICEQKYRFGYILLACGHGIYCYKCVYSTQKCPYKCGKILGFTRAFIN